MALKIREKEKIQMTQPRVPSLLDRKKIVTLYKKVSRNIGGIARTESEITLAYVSYFMTKSKQNGIQLVIENLENSNELIAEIHCYKLEPKVFDHILSELTIVVHPSFQRMGIGKLLFNKLLYLVESEMPNILRIELIARESNTNAINFYNKIGFKIEGKLENRIRSNNGNLEADIPMAWFNKNYKGNS
jgi:ribosomal protein S18 acetylase RimI-like enzyme